MLDLSTMLAWLLAAVLLWAGWLNLRGPEFVRQEFLRWGYPAWLRLIVGAGEWIAAALLVSAEGRQIGSALALLILLGVLFSLSRSREWMRLEYPLVLVAMAFSILLT